MANKLTDPRYKQFAQAFAGLRSDGGASVQDPNSINSVLAGYQTNEYGKWVANTTNETRALIGLAPLPAAGSGAAG